MAEERTWIGTEPGFDRERTHAGYTRTMDDPAYLTLVAEDGATLAGTLRLYPRENGHALGMMLAHGYRGRGLGTQLVLAAIDWARERGSPRIELGVFPHNAGALRQYEKTGFRVTRRLEAAMVRQTGEVWDVIEMELLL